MKGQQDNRPDEDREIPDGGAAEKKKAFAIAAIVCGGVALLFFAAMSIFFFFDTAVAISFLFLAGLSLIAGSVLLFLYFLPSLRRRLARKGNAYLGLPIGALALDLAAAPLFFLAIACLYTNVGWFALILFLATVVSPLTGIVIGILSLCRGPKKIGTASVVISAIAIALPMIVVIVMIILFSANVIVINLM